jgi:hypothetical protein
MSISTVLESDLEEAYTWKNKHQNINYTAETMMVPTLDLKLPYFSINIHTEYYSASVSSSDV